MQKIDVKPEQARARLLVAYFSESSGHGQAHFYIRLPQGSFHLVCQLSGMIIDIFHPRQ